MRGTDHALVLLSILRPYFLNTLLIVAALVIGVSAPAQSIKQAEMAADRCMHEVALEFLDQAPRTERESRDGRLLRARLLVQLERGRDAVAVLKLVAPSSNPKEEADRLLALGFAYGAAGQLQEAERTFERARALGADGDLVDEGIAGLRIQAGQYAKAERILRAVLRRTPLLSGALYNLAVVRSHNDDVAEAAALIRQAWFVGYQDPDQLKRDRDLKKLRETKGLIDDLLAATTPRCRTY